MEKLIEPLSKTIFEEGIEIAEEYGELTIDSVLDDNILGEIPLIRTALGFGRITVAVRDRILVRNLLTFLKKIQENNIEKKYLEKHLKTFEKNPRKREKELEIIISYCDHYTIKIKNKILANIYTSFIVGDITWDDFFFLIELLESIKVFDICTLKDLYQKGIYGVEDEYYPVSLQRLNALGLIEYFNGMKMLKTRGNDKKTIIAEITDLGNVFFEIAMKGIDISESDCYPE